MSLLLYVLGACFNDQGVPTVLMEYCAGGNLRQRLIKAMHEQKPLKLAKKFQYAHELALGMYFLHGCSEPVIHRDLKPANILLSKDDHIKISDFGLSKFMPQRRRADIEAMKESDRYTMTGETGSYRVCYFGAEALRVTFMPTGTDLLRLCIVYGSRSVSTRGLQRESGRVLLCDDRVLDLHRNKTVDYN